MLYFAEHIIYKSNTQTYCLHMAGNWQRFFYEEPKKEHECHISRKKEAVFSNLQQRHLIT